MRIKKLLPALLLILICLQINLSQSSTPQIPQLAVSATTDKPAYTYRSTVTVSGNLWLSGEPTDGIIGIEVINPNIQSLIVRAVPAGSPTPSGTVEIVAVTPCDQLGNPKYTFRKGTEHAHVNVTIRNNDPVSSRYVLITVCAYDSDMTPILPEVMYLETTVPAGGTIKFKPDFPLYEWLSTGQATFYASVFTDWPKNGGIPYTVEKTAQFTITSGSTSSETTSVKQAETTATGTYNMTFRLPPTDEAGGPIGNYTVKVSAWSQGYTATTSTNFSREFQIIGDVNFDHLIDILDVVAVTGIYGFTSETPGWNPEADVMPSGKIDISDVVVVTSNYGTRY